MNLLFVILSLAMANTMNTTLTVPLSAIRTGQTSVGHNYAFYKAQKKANLNPLQDWKTFSKKEYAALWDEVTKEVSEGVPVFIAPNGQMHAIDQHHDMYVLQTLAPNMHPAVLVKVERDFTKEHHSVSEYKKIIVSNSWIYHKTLDEVLNQPLSVKDLKDSPERSVVGMTFLRFEDSGIPLKGKHFLPFIQFLLIDFINDKNLMTFSAHFSDQDVEKLVDLLESSSEIKLFLKDRLQGKTPQNLKTFLTP